MTELEANKKICPFISSDSQETDWTMCQSSQCMAWKIAQENAYTDQKIVEREESHKFVHYHKLEEYIKNKYGSEYVEVPKKDHSQGHITFGIKQSYGEGFCTRIGDV